MANDLSIVPGTSCGTGRFHWCLATTSNFPHLKSTKLPHIKINSTSPHNFQKHQKIQENPLGFHWMFTIFQLLALSHGPWAGFTSRLGVSCGSGAASAGCGDVAAASVCAGGAGGGTGAEAADEGAAGTDAAGAARLGCSGCLIHHVIRKKNELFAVIYKYVVKKMANCDKLIHNLFLLLLFVLYWPLEIEEFMLGIRCIKIYIRALQHLLRGSNGGILQLEELSDT